MEKMCVKCESKMVEAKLDSHPIRVYNAPEKPTSKNMSEVSHCYVCSNCGYIELYALNPEKFN